MDSLFLIGVGLLGLGALLLFLEAFVPSGGILGLVAFACAVAGIVYLFKYEAVWGAIGILGTMVLGPMVFVSALKILPNTKFGSSVMGQTGEEIARDHEEATRAIREERISLLGSEGIAITDMRPNGVIEVHGKRYDSMAHGGIVDHGQRVRVTAVDGLSITVRGIDF